MVGQRIFMQIIYYDLLESPTKRWYCVQVDHHDRIGGTVEEFGKERWRLHTYTTAGQSSMFMGYTVNHHMLFEKDVALFLHVAL